MATKVVRSLDTLVTSEDDARLFQRMFNDGLFNTNLNGLSSVSGTGVNIPELYGIIQGRDFHVDAQKINVPIAENSTGKIYVHMDLEQTPEARVSIIGHLDSENYTPVYEDLNFQDGKVADLLISTYTATAIGVTAVTPDYEQTIKPVGWGLSIDGRTITLEKDSENRTVTIPDDLNSTYSYSTSSIDVTLEASKWDQDKKSYTISNSKITGDSLNLFDIGKNITIDQYKALSKAMIKDGGQTAGTATLIALNKVPTIDIPIRITFIDRTTVTL